jgi:hypothetical protein
MMLRQLHLDYFSKVGFLAINSDDSSTFNEDTILGNLTTVQEYQLQFPYLIDSEQTVAKAFRALTLPEAFLFKNEGGGYFSLFYHGRLVSNDTQLTVADQPLSVALSRFVRDQDPPLIQKPSQGCGITWI